MRKIPNNYTEWKLMAEAIKIDALRDRELFISSCAQILQNAIEEAEVEKTNRKRGNTD